MKNNSVIKPISALFAMALFLSFCFDLSVDTIRTPSYAFLAVCILILIITFRKSLPDTSVFYTIIAGIFLKLTYVMYTPVWCRQHDFIDFGAGEGHAAYMEYILSHRALPDFDPREVWSFFQPPLHHMISAAWMWLNIRLGIGENHMHKNVQVLPLVYMCVLMLVTYFICRQLNMKKGATLVALLITSFHPICILMSGSLNNDALSVMLSVIAIYVALTWYLYPTTAKIVLLAASVGLAMSAKLSAGLLAFPIGAMMIYKIVKDTEKFRDKAKIISYILELVPFALIVIPLGLWWPVRNKMLFGMPFGYIPEVSENVAGIPLWQRLIDIRTASPFLYMKSNGFSYDEYNIILATIKSSLFGEGDFAKLPVIVTAVGWVLTVLAVVVLLIQIEALIRTCFNAEAGPDTGIKILLGVGAASFVIGYLAFALKGANLSAMDPRYAAAALPMLSIFVGILYDRLDVLKRDALKRMIMVSATAFAAVSCLFYILVGLYS